MDLSFIDNLFRPPVKTRYVLSEETIETLKKWELLGESDQLAKLQRMLHTAPARERNALRKAIAELEKREAAKKKSRVVKKMGSYEVYDDWGKAIKSEGPPLNPDYWYNREASKYGDKGVRTFIYNTYAEHLYVYDISGYQYNHHTFVEDLTHEGDLQHGDIDPDILKMWRKKYGNDNLFDIVTDENLQDDEHFVHGRTGPFPLHGTPKEMKFYASIWTRVNNKKILDDVMNQLNKKLSPIIKKKFQAIIMP